jgi:excisionase family DNA binding protein
MTTNGHGFQAPHTSKLWTAEEVSERWSIPTAGVYRLARSRQIPSVKLGRYVRFRPADIEAFEAAGGCESDWESVAILDGHGDRGVRTATGTARGTLNGR